MRTRALVAFVVFAALPIIGACSSDDANPDSEGSVSGASTSAPSSIASPDDQPAIALATDPAVCTRLRDGALVLYPDTAANEPAAAPLTGIVDRTDPNRLECTSRYGIDANGDVFGSTKLTIGSVADALAVAGAADMASALSAIGYRCSPSTTAVSGRTDALFCELFEDDVPVAVAVAVQSGDLIAFYSVSPFEGDELPSNELVALALESILG